MQIHSRETLDSGRERLVLVPDTPDDLWHLYHVIAPEDRVAGDTNRRIQRNDEQLRSTGGEREHMYVTLAVNDVEFDRFASRLRISGEIVDASREDQIGHSHTLNVEIHDELTVEKYLQSDQEERLEGAVEASDEPSVAIAAVEEGSAVVHTVAQYGTEEYASVQASSGKGEYTGNRTALFDELGEILAYVDSDRIILAGPGFVKQDAGDYLESKYPALVDRITTVDTSSGGARGVQEVLKRGALEDVKTAARISEEAEYLDRLMERIATDEPATYGIEEVGRAAEYGAVERVLIVDDLLREERGPDGSWEIDVDEVLTDVEHGGGEVTVVSSDFEPGQRLANLGGIAALLRYDVS